MAPPGFLPVGQRRRLRPSRGCSGLSSMRRGPRSPRGRDAPAPTRCVQAQCFDLLVRNCVACKLLRTPEPGPGKSGRAPRAGPRGSLGEEGEGAAATEAPPSAPPTPPGPRVPPPPSQDVGAGDGLLGTVGRCLDGDQPSPRASHRSLPPLPHGRPLPTLQAPASPPPTPSLTGRPSPLPPARPPRPLLRQQLGRAAWRPGPRCSRRSRWEPGPPRTPRPRCRSPRCSSAPPRCWAWRWPWSWWPW